MPNPQNLTTSQESAATLPLTGNELVRLVQGGANVRAAVSAIAPSVPIGGGVPTFFTRTAAQAAVVASSVTGLQTSGYAAVGDAGGGFYVKGGSAATPGAFQSADGAFWTPALGPGQEGFSVKQFGAVGDNTTDDTAAINACFASLTGKGGLVIIPGAHYKITDTIAVGHIYGGTNQASAPYSFISIRAYSASDTLANFDYYGPNDGRAAVIFGSNKYFSCDGLVINNHNGDNTKGVGLILGGSGTWQTITFPGNVTSSFLVNDNISGGTSLATGFVMSSTFINPNTSVNVAITGTLLVSQHAFVNAEVVTGPHGSATTNSAGALSGSPGTATLGGSFRQCQVSNFGTGMSDGNYGASSEILWLDSGASGCGVVGWIANDFNTLDHVFVDSGWGTCVCGLDTGVSEAVWILGGSASINFGQDGGDFRVQQNTTLHILGFRSENAQININGKGGSIAVRNCIFKAVASGVGGTSIVGNFLNVSIHDSFLSGRVMFTNNPQKITMIGVTLPTDANSDFPFMLPSTGLFANQTSTHLVLKDNMFCPDFEGSINAQWAGGNFAIPTVLGVTQNFNSVANSGTPYAVDYQVLSHVRQLAEGPIPNFSTLYSNTLTTSQGTAIGVNTLGFTTPVPSWVAPGQVVSNSTHPSSVPGGTWIKQVFVFSGALTLCILNNNIASPGVSTGDTISFGNSFPNMTPGTGNNLRIQGVFASSNSLAITFVRTVHNVVTSGQSLTLHINSGSDRFFPADVGKAVSIASSGNSGWTNWYATIMQYTDSTHVVTQASNPQQGVSLGSPTSISVGTNEPDGNYMVLCTGNVNETFWVDAIASTGFTVHSSNATSTAIVTCLIVR